MLRLKVKNNHLRSSHLRSGYLTSRHQRGSYMRSSHLRSRHPRFKHLRSSQECQKRTLIKMLNLSLDELKLIAKSRCIKGKVHLIGNFKYICNSGIKVLVKITSRKNTIIVGSSINKNSDRHKKSF